MWDSFLSVPLLFSVGAISGFLSSTPLGPINLLVADNVVSGRDYPLKAFLSGVVIADLIFASLAFWGYYQYIRGSAIGTGMTIAGAGFVTLIGFVSLYQTMQDQQNRWDAKSQWKTKKRRQSGALLKGLFLCGSNPAFLLFWVYVAGVIDYMELPVNTTGLITAMVLPGIILGDMLWFQGFIKAIGQGTQKIGPGTVRNIRLFISWTLILLGIGTLWSRIIGPILQTCSY